MFKWWISGAFKRANENEKTLMVVMMNMLLDLSHKCIYLSLKKVFSLNAARKTVMGRRQRIDPVGPDKYVATSRKEVKTSVCRLKYYKYPISKQLTSSGKHTRHQIKTFSSAHRGKGCTFKKNLGQCD